MGDGTKSLVIEHERLIDYVDELSSICSDIVVAYKMGKPVCRDYIDVIDALLKKRAVNAIGKRTT
jgi:hypothetical protein